MVQSDEVVFRLGIPPEEGKYPGLAASTRLEHGLLVQRDVEVRMRDGVRLYVDVMRPAHSSKCPVILTYSPYGKHGRKNFEMFRAEERSVSDPGMSGEGLSHYTVWEGPDPRFWCDHGFAVVNADARGSWGCEGSLTFHTRQEAIDGYDLVEWAAGQPWSNGRVGMAGVSYLAWSQWNVATTQPPHLCAINPWGGYSDPYRDIRMHGGIPETRFARWWIESTAFSRSRVEDVPACCVVHPLIDEYWRERIPDLGLINCPVFAVVDWGDQAIHTRGVIEAFKRVSSKDKWLEVHGQLKWPYFYRSESVARQLQFFGQFLRDDFDSDVREWPRVRIEVRRSYLVGEMRGEKSWPLEGTMYTKLFLGSDGRLMSDDVNVDVGCVDYDSTDGQVVFEHRFGEDTEITGHSALKLYFESPDAEDADLFVWLEKLDVDGNRVGFPFQSTFRDGPIAMGWLRVSHREVDDAMSTPWQPWHKHERELALVKGEPVELDVELWPSSTAFKAGESLRLTIQGREPFANIESPVSLVHEETRNAGRHVIHVGGESRSYLVVPVIPGNR